MGGALPEGPREPFELPAPDLERARVLAATGFDPVWGTPPGVTGLVWNEARFLYEPTRDSAGLPYRQAEREGVYAQAYRPAIGPLGGWAMRWVRVVTTLPDEARPYRALSSTEASAVETDVRRYALDARSGGTSSVWDQIRRGEISIDPPGTPRAVPTLSRGTVTRSFPPSAYAWVKQADLPVGCPYPYPYLPVPVADYVSGAWLDPAYTPSIPLPPPYDLTPWRCGVPGTPPVDHRKGKQPSDQMRIELVVPRPPSAPTVEMSNGASAGDGELDLSFELDPTGPPPSSSTPVDPEAGGAAGKSDVASLREELGAAEREIDQAKLARAQAGTNAERAEAEAEVRGLTREAAEIASRLHDAVVQRDRDAGEDRYVRPDVGMPPPSGLLAAPQDSAPPPPPVSETAAQRTVRLRKKYEKDVQDFVDKVRERVVEREGLMDDYRYHRLGSKQSIDKALAELKTTLLQVEADGEFPAKGVTPNVKALVWALQGLVTDERQQSYQLGVRSNSWGDKAVSASNSGDWKCNKLVADAYSFGAGRGLSVGQKLGTGEADGAGFPAARDPQTGLVWPPMANELGGSSNLRSLSPARPADESSTVTRAMGATPGTAVKPSPGDILAFPNPNRRALGHSGLYLGNGLMVSARGTGIEVGTIASEGRDNRRTAMVRQWTGSGR